MPWGAAAIAGSALVGAGTGMYSAGKAASAQKKAANKAADLQLNMFNTVRDDLAPYRAAGGAGLGAVYQLLGLDAPAYTTSANEGSKGLSSADLAQIRTDIPGLEAEYARASAHADKNSPNYLAQGLDSLDNYTKYWYDNLRNPNDYALPTPQPAAGGSTGGGALNSEGIQKFLESTPGYQFTRDQGMQGVEHSLAARGLGGLSGSLGKGLARFVSGLADSTYNERLNQYMGLVNTGANAANQTGGYSTATAGNVGGNITGAGAATASGYVGAANAISGGVNGAANGYLTSRYLGSGMYAPGGGAAAGGGAGLPAATRYTGATDLALGA